MSLKASKLAMVPFVSVDNMMRLVHHVGIEAFLADLARDEVLAGARAEVDGRAVVARHSDRGLAGHE